MGLHTKYLCFWAKLKGWVFIIIFLIFIFMRESVFLKMGWWWILGGCVKFVLLDKMKRLVMAVISFASSKHCFFLHICLKESTWGFLKPQLHSQCYQLLLTSIFIFNLDSSILLDRTVLRFKMNNKNFIYKLEGLC